MKYISLALLVLVALVITSCAHFIPAEVENGKLPGVLPMQYEKASYQVTKPVAGTREEIFRQTRKWAAFHIYDPTQSLAIRDNLPGDIITTGRISKQTIKIDKTPVLIPNVNYSVSIEAFE